MTSKSITHTNLHKPNNKLVSAYDAFPSPKLDPRWALVSKTTELWGLEGMLRALSIKRGRGAC